ncbi:hypothetical protein J0A71_08g16720 [Encephalitozoon cuniculi]|nr:hypothetical protein J0A71_08g16720 [Encephalitozoon cuniculi]
MCDGFFVRTGKYRGGGRWKVAALGVLLGEGRRGRAFQEEGGRDLPPSVQVHWSEKTGENARPLIVKGNDVDEIGEDAGSSSSLDGSESCCSEIPEMR